jgi:LPS-assembly protein
VKKYFLLILLLLSPLTPVFARMLQLPEVINITADEFQYDANKKIFIAAGNVKINAENFYLSAENVSFKMDEGMIDAEKNIFYKDKYISLKAEKISINTRKKTGILNNATIYIQKDNVVIHADEIERISEDVFHAENASYTTCRCEGTPVWSISSKKFEIELGKTAFAKNILFNVKGVPIFFIPAGGFPAKTERTTGFLMPHLTYLGRDGVIFDIPFYVVLSRNSDITLTPVYYSKRGAGGEVELRYINSPFEKGNISFRYLNEYLLENGRKRWLMQFLNTSFTPKYNNIIDINLISDRDYFADFGEVLQNQGFTYTESRISLTKYSRYSLFSGVVDYFQDILNAGGNEPVYHRLPEISYSLFPLQLPGNTGYFSLNLVLTNYVFETRQFEYFRSFRTKGVSLIMEPKFESPFRIGRFLEILPEAKLKSKAIYIEGLEKEFNPRLTPELKLNVNSSVTKNYSSFQHLIKPGVTLLYEGKTKRVEDIIQYESPEKKLVSFYLKNFIIQRTSQNNIFMNREILQLVIVQNFFLNSSPETKNVYLNLSESGSGNYTNNFWGELSIKATQNLYLRFNSSFDEEKKKFSFYNINLNYYSPWQTGVSVDYKYTTSLPDQNIQTRNDEIVGAIQQTFYNFRVSASERYSFINKKFVEGLYELHYTSSCKCWYITFDFIDKPGTMEDRFKVLFNLIGLGI